MNHHSPEKLAGRLSLAHQFATGTHPLIRAAFWEPHTSPPEVTLPTPARKPRFSAPTDYSLLQTTGDAVTESMIIKHLATGQTGIQVKDGFNANFLTDIGFIHVFVDTTCDPLLAGIIQEAKTQISHHQSWSTARKLFEISSLCFGDHGQKRYPLEAYRSSHNLPHFMLGEFIWTTHRSDLECALSSLCLQVVDQQCGLNIRWWWGQVARFSHYCHGADSHAWNTVSDPDNGTLLLDWTNYPPAINNLFASVRNLDPDSLYAQFRQTYGSIPYLTQDKYPPTCDQYDRYRDGENPLLGLRESVVYWNRQEEYLGTCPLPWGWDKA